MWVKLVRQVSFQPGVEIHSLSARYHMVERSAPGRMANLPVSVLRGVPEACVRRLVLSQSRSPYFVQVLVVFFCSGIVCLEYYCVTARNHDIVESLTTCVSSKDVFEEGWALSSGLELPVYIRHTSRCSVVGDRSVE